MIDFPGFKRQKIETVILLDVGTETVKALLFEVKNQEIKILSSSLEYFDRYGIFESWDFERDILKKAIFRAIQKLSENDKKSVVLGLPADILKARIVYQNFKRLFPKKTIDEKEEKEIYQTVIGEAEKNIRQIYSQQSGILPADIQFVNLKILEMKIDGYQVPVLQKYKSQNLEFRILATFLPIHYLEKIKNIIESLGLKVREIVHEVEGLNFYFGDDAAERTSPLREVHFKENNNVIFIDIGGKTTQIFLLRYGILEKIDEFSLGGQIFSKAISERLGLREVEARILKESYSKKELTHESSERIKEILEFTFQVWFKGLKVKLKEMTGGSLASLNIVLFGGGSQLLNIKDILKSSEWDKISFSESLEAKILNNPQETPLLLMAYAQCYSNKFVTLAKL